MSNLSPYAQHQFPAQGDNDSFSHVFGFVPDGSRVLDIGCSTGNLGLALEERKSCSVVGVDINESDISVAKERGLNAHVLDATVEGSLDDFGSFDVIVFADVLEHLNDPRQMLRNVRRSLSPAGVVLYSIPNMSHLSVRLDLMSGVFPYTETGLLDNTHVHFYDRAEVEAIFADSGYRIMMEKPVLIEYPEEWVNARLASLGLQPTESFPSMLQTSESGVFQFIGVAEPIQHADDAAHTARERLSPLNEIKSYTTKLVARANAAETQFNEVTRQLEGIRPQLTASQNKVVEVERRLDEALKRIDESESERARLNEELIRSHYHIRQLQASVRDFEHSTSWRITAPLRFASGLLARKPG